LLGRLRSVAIYVVASGLTFSIVAAPWSYRLERRFGNPFFPLLNSVFRSPEFTTEPLRHFRFIPSSLGEALWRPFSMLDPVSMIHEELRAPDLRYAVLVGLLCLLAVQWLRAQLSPPGELRRGESPIDERLLAALGCAFAVDWAAWLYVSGNSRYFLPMACVAAVLVLALAFRVFEGRPKLRNYVLALVFAAPGLQLLLGTEFRLVA